MRPAGLGVKRASAAGPLCTSEGAGAGASASAFLSQAPPQNGPDLLLSLSCVISLRDIEMTRHRLIRSRSPYRHLVYHAPFLQARCSHIQAARHRRSLSFLLLLQHKLLHRALLGVCLSRTSLEARPAGDETKGKRQKDDKQGQAPNIIDESTFIHAAPVRPH